MLRIKLEGSVRTKIKIIAVEIETLFLDIGHTTIGLQFNDFNFLQYALLKRPIK